MNSRTTKVDESELGLTLASANPAEYPTVYSDNIWEIVTKTDTSLFEVIGSQQSFTQKEVNHIIAQYIYNSSVAEAKLKKTVDTLFEASVHRVQTGQGSNSAFILGQGTAYNTLGSDSLAFGCRAATASSATGAAAFGCNSSVTAPYAVAMGNSVAFNPGAFSCGVYNSKGSITASTDLPSGADPSIYTNLVRTNTLFAIGNGLSDNARSTVLDISYDGSLYVLGVGQFDGTNKIKNNALNPSIQSVQTVFNNINASLTSLIEVNSSISDLTYKYNTHDTRLKSLAVETASIGSTVSIIDSSIYSFPLRVSSQNPYSIIQTYANNKANTATGTNSLALCTSTKVAGHNSMAIGYQNSIDGSCSFAAGSYNSISADSCNNIVSGTNNKLLDETIRSFVIGCDNSTYRSGECMIVGSANRICYYNNIIFGNNNYICSPFNSITGDSNTINSSCGEVVIFGNQNIVSDAMNVHIEGYNNSVYALTLGTSVDYVHIEGMGCICTSSYTHVEGKDCSANGLSSHAEGSETYTYGHYSHAEGYRTIASGMSCHAEGSTTIASGNDSHAEGGETKASGQQSHAEGSYTIASGESAHAEGSYTTASVPYSHAAGLHTQAKSRLGETAIGMYNKSEWGYSTNTIKSASTGTIFSIGIGTTESSRRNAIEVLSDGSIYFTGIGGYTDTIWKSVSDFNYPIINPEIKSIQTIISENVVPNFITVCCNTVTSTSGTTVVSTTKVAVNKPLTDTGVTVPNCSATRYSNVTSFHVVDTGTEPFYSGVYRIICPTINGFTTLNQFALGALKLTNLDTTNWDTSQVQSMNRTFEYCQSLTYLDTAGWDLKNLLSLYDTFYACVNLTSLDTTYWTLSSLETMSGAFCNCQSLTKLNCLNWNPNQCTNFYMTFLYCTSLTELDLRNWSVKPTNSQYMFYGCSNLTTLRLDNWNNENNTAYEDMFGECSNLTNLYLGPNFFKCGSFSGTSETFDFSAVTNWSTDSLTYSLITNLYDRSSYGRNVNIILASAVYNKLTADQKTAITNKKFTLQSV
jgi:surface protein